MGRYSSGDWFALVTDDGMAMLSHDVSPELAESVWLALGEGGGLTAVLEGIVSGFGASLSALPPFAVVSRTPSGDEVRVAVRGPLEVRAASSSGEVIVGGMGVATWNERGVEGVESFTVSAPGASAPRLPINDGIVLAGQIAFTFGAPQTVPPDPSLPVLLEVPATPKPPAGPDTEQSVPDASSIEAPVLETPNLEPSAVAPPVVDAPSVENPPLADDAVGDAAEPGGQETGPENPGPGDPAPEDPGPESVPHEPAVTTAGPAPGGDTTIEPLVAHRSREVGTVDGFPAPEDYDRLLYGDTTKTSVEGAAVRAVEPPAEPPVPAGMISGLPQFARTTLPEPVGRDRLGDHDDETVSTAKIQSLMAQAGAQAGAVTPGGHTAPGRGAPATLVVSTGERVTLDRGAVVGRRPQLVRVQGGNVPRLVTVPSPNQDISRSHLELRLIGDDVLAVDLDTMNGTRLLRPGCEPVRLQPGESTILVAGDRLEMGDGVELGFEGLR